jgi:uncharacterized protein
MSDETPRHEPSLGERTRSPGRNLVGERRQEGKGVLDLTEAIGEDGSVRSLSPASAPPRSEGKEDAASARAAESGPRLALGGGSEGIASAAAAGAAAAALAGLATLSREKQREGETPLGPVGKTLEDIVRDLLRPLLRAWLDDHLPGVVERLVREEIARVVREAGLR